jgi:hypothetical protein
MAVQRDKLVDGDLVCDIEHGNPFPGTPERDLPGLKRTTLRLLFVSAFCESPGDST